MQSVIANLAKPEELTTYTVKEDEGGEVQVNYPSSIGRAVCSRVQRSGGKSLGIVTG